MNILSGSFGAGRGFVQIRAVEITPTSLFSTAVKISFSEISSVEPLAGHSQKKLGETAGYGATGVAVGSLLGPIGMLAGGALGALAGGRKDYITFTCRLTDGRYFVATATAVEFSELQSQAAGSAPQRAIPSREPRHEAKAKSNTRKPSSTKRSAIKKRSIINSGPKPLSGREDLAPPKPLCSLYAQLSETNESSSQDADQNAAVSGTLNYARYLHRVKWQYFDREIDDLDVLHTILLRIITEEQCAAYHERARSNREADLERIDAALDSTRSELTTLRSRKSYFLGRLLDPPQTPLVEKIGELEKDRPLAEYELQRAKMQWQKCRARSQYLLNRFSASLPTDALAAFRSHYSALVNVELDGVDGWVLSIPWALSHLKHFRPEVVQVVPEPVAEALIAEAAEKADARFADDGSPSRAPKERLKALKELLDEGLISGDEFNARRRAILDNI